MDIVPIDETLYDKLQIFCNECNKLGYKNNASFDEMISLINFVKKKVKDKTGININLEIKIIE